MNSLNKRQLHALKLPKGFRNHPLRKRGRRENGDPFLNAAAMRRN